MLKRLTVSTAGGAGVSLGLGLAMMAMIATEFKAQETPETLAFEINPQVEDIALPPEIKRPDPLQKVETPPAPPPIERQASDVPSEPISSVTGAIPDFDLSTLNLNAIEVTVVDADPQPLVRIAPIMPNRADRSGHCNMVFDVSASGKPYNVEALSCSQSLFRNASIKSVQKWNYNPRIQNGQAVAMQGLRTTIWFDLRDERGNPIPE